MLKCSYILYVHNNEETISKVIDSLAKINGNFRREFIIIEDGSTDNSLYIIKKHINTLPRATVITQEHTGSAISVNKALSLIKADYVHFVSAIRETLPNETLELIDLCVKYDAGVAFYSSTQSKNRVSDKMIEVIDIPLKEILAGDKFSNIRNVGEANSLVSYNLLAKIGGADEEIYAVHPSLSLRCATLAKFVCIFKNQGESIRGSKTNRSTDSNFNDYNDLLAVYNFIKEEPKVAEAYTKELIYNLYVYSQSLKHKVDLLWKYLSAKYLNKYSVDKVRALYQIELKKLF